MLFNQKFMMRAKLFFDYTYTQYNLYMKYIIYTIIYTHVFVPGWPYDSP